MIRKNLYVVLASLLALMLPGRPAAPAWGAELPGAPRDTALDDARRTEEKLVRGAYLKLVRYQRAYVAQAATANAQPAAELQIELRGIETGRVEEILKRPLGELASAGTGRQLRARPIVYQYLEGPEHLVYRAELRDATDLAEWDGWDGMTVADHLRRMGPAGEKAEMYTAYEVALSLGGERRTYRAFAVYGSGSRDAIQVVDNVLGSRTLSDLLTAEFPPVRAPWARYIESPTYAAVARQIAAARRAGRSPIPARAPAGTLAGDGVVPEPAVPRAAAAKAAVCAPVTVGNLRVEVPATGQPQVSDAMIVANSAVAFANDATPDLVVLFQGDVQMTVTAMNVEPAQAADQLRWKLERDPTDTVATGLPTLDATAGPQVRVTPGTAGNFRLICFTDMNGNGQYDGGEEKKVLRFAVVRSTVNANFCELSSGGVGFVTASELDPGEMALSMDQSINGVGMILDCEITLEGGGAQRNIGTGKVMLGDVGNLRATSAQVVYAAAPGASAPLGYEKPVVTPPMLDAREAGNGGDSAFRGFSSMSTPRPGPGGNGIKVTAMGADKPGAGPWNIKHPSTNTTWATTQGGYDFREFVAGFTTSFQKVYVAFATADWAVRIVGRNEGGVWRNNGSNITLQGQPPPAARMTLTVTGTTPQTGDAAGMKVTGPTYALESNRRFAYSLANLTAPTLSATAGNAQASLTWTAPAGARTYNVKRSPTSGGPYATIASGLTATSYTNTGLQNGTTYYFVVSAVDGALESPNSTQVSVMPTNGATQPPTAPKNLVATRGTNQITLTWSGAAGANTYKVKRSTTSGGPYTTTVVEGLTQTTYTNTGLTKGTTYYYVVTAVNGAGESPNSTQASATP